MCSSVRSLFRTLTEKRCRGGSLEGKETEREQNEQAGYDQLLLRRGDNTTDQGRLYLSETFTHINKIRLCICPQK